MAGTDNGAPESPASDLKVAELLRRCTESGTRVRPTGAGTKAWGNTSEHDLELSTAAIDSVLEHKQGDLTAVL